MAQPPPVPLEQQSDKVQGEHSPPDRSKEVKIDPAGGTAGYNTDEQGQAGNRHQNLVETPSTQDR